MSALRRAGAPIVIALVAAGCAGGGAIRVSDVTPESVPELEAQRTERPGDPAVLARLGVGYFKQGRYQNARVVLDSAVALNPRNGIAAIYLGMTAEALGEFSAARSAYGQYLGVGRSGELRNVARQRLSLLSRRELEYQARQTLAQEATLVQQPPDPGTIAVMPFNYSGTNEELRPLTRGLAQLVVTDLAKSRQVRVLERERLQAILDEMRLSEESRADPQTAVRSGRLLRAERILTGSFADREQEMRLDAAVVDVTTAGVAAAAGAQDALSRLFDLEKQLVFSIFANLGIQLTDAEREAINQRPTANLQAFLAYSRGLEAEDRGDFAAAQEAFQQAVNLDPNFQVAAQSAGTAGDANQAAQQTVTDVEVVVVQEEPEEVGAPPPEGQDALTTTINELAPTTTSQQQQQQQQVGSTPPGQRDTTGEAGGSEGVRPTTGTIIIIIRRP